LSERRRPCWREWLPLAVLLTCPERVVGTPPQCLHRPDQESTLYFGAVIDIQPFPNGKVRPFAETGGAFGRSLSPPNPGEKRSFLLPQWGLGVDVPTRFGVLSAIGFMRILDRWPDRLDKATMTTLLIGFRPGGRR